MSGPNIAPELVKKEVDWKRLFVKATGFGAGFTVVLAILAGLGIWYSSRPKPPKPWDQKAIIAEYDYAQTEGENNTIVIFYTLINNTDFDYEIKDADSIRLGAKLSQENSLSMEDQKDFLIGDMPLFIPGHQRTRFGIHLKVPYSEREKSDATVDERHDYGTRLAKYIATEIDNLGGFVIFDEQHRYQIVFPGGWQERTKQPTKVDSSKK